MRFAVGLRKDILTFLTAVSDHDHGRSKAFLQNSAGLARFE